ncbi:MAG: YtxH domain-containing protein [Chloroflexota bacterium]|nr:YtxH domain-containing protein [Chloroflexota bacterium]
MARQRHDAAFIVGGLLGGIVGAVVTLLSAPQAGARTRAQMNESLQPALEGLQAAGYRVASESHAVIERASEALSTVSAVLPGASQDPPTDHSAIEFDALADDAAPLVPDPMASPPLVPRGDADQVIDVAPSHGDAPEDRLD